MARWREARRFLAAAHAPCAHSKLLSLSGATRLFVHRGAEPIVVVSRDAGPPLHARVQLSAFPPTLSVSGPLRTPSALPGQHATLPSSFVAPTTVVAPTPPAVEALQPLPTHALDHPTATRLLGAAIPARTRLFAEALVNGFLVLSAPALRRSRTLSRASGAVVHVWWFHSRLPPALAPSQRRPRLCGVLAVDSTGVVHLAASPSWSPSRGPPLVTATVRTGRM